MLVYLYHEVETKNTKVVPAAKSLASDTIESRSDSVNENMEKTIFTNFFNAMVNNEEKQRNLPGILSLTS